MNRVVFAGICMTALLTAGCMFSDNRVETDVTQDPVYWPHYRRDGVYTLLRPVFLHGYYNTGDLSLAPPDPGDHPSKYRGPTLDEYLAAPPKFPDIKGVVAAGTRLRVTNAVAKSRLSARYYARILDGPFAKSIVVLNDLSEPETWSGYAARPQPVYLRLEP